MGTIKSCLVVVSFAFLCACGGSEPTVVEPEKEDQAVITADDMEKEAAEFLESDEGKDYWDFSDPKAPTAEDINGKEK